MNFQVVSKTTFSENKPFRYTVKPECKFPMSSNMVIIGTRRETMPNRCLYERKKRNPAL